LLALARTPANRQRMLPNRFAGGIPFVEQAEKLQPKYPFGHYLLGLLYLDTGDTARAIPRLEAATGMVPQEPQFLFALGNAYAKAGRKQEAARAREPYSWA